MPSTEREDYGNHCRAKGREQAARDWLVQSWFPLDVYVNQERSRKYQQRDGRNFQNHEPALDCSSRTHAHAVDYGEHGQGNQSDLPLAGVPSGEFQKIAREGDGYGGHSAGLYYQEQHPSIEE